MGTNRFHAVPEGAKLIPPSPGPWHASSTLNGAAFDIGASDCANVALVYGPDGIGPDCFVSNAALIAAAPDMLAALKDMLAGWRYIRNNHGDLYGVGWDRAEDAARAAIAKAEGTAP